VIDCVVERRTGNRREDVLERRRVLIVTSSCRAGSSTERLGLMMAGSLRATSLDVDLINVGDLGLPWCTGAPDQMNDEAVRAWRHRVGRAVGYIWVSAEWHGSMAGTLKNALDLLSESDLYWKVVALVAQAGGAMGAVNALSHMRAVAQNLGAWALPVQLSVSAAEIKSAPTPAVATRIDRIARELDEAVSKLDRVM
jgi:FMN reductase